MTTAAGVRWCWQLLVTNLHSGGQDRMVVFYSNEARVGLGSHLVTE